MDSKKTAKRETFKLWDLVRLILDIAQYLLMPNGWCMSISGRIIRIHQELVTREKRKCLQTKIIDMVWNCHKKLATEEFERLMTSAYIFELYQNSADCYLKLLIYHCAVHIDMLHKHTFILTGWYSCAYGWRSNGKISYHTWGLI